MRIADDKVEEVRAASDIVDVVSDYVKLKRRGSNFIGLCPFHNEKTPSFNVNPGMNIFKCFGCSKGGDVFSFVQEIEHIGFLESVRMLAERAGIPLPQEEAEQSERASEIESILFALRFAARFFYDQLTQQPAGETALDYLRGRGFTAATIKQFGLGYAPGGWDALLKAAEKEQLEAETLEKAGLVIPRKDGDGYYDRYRHRVIFPILSHVGKVLGFGGRILDKDTDQPKYINSPQTKVYDKSRVLYGLYQGKQAIRRSEEVILVEGYTDVISLHQAGVQNVVASSGTALTAEQVKMLSRYAKRVLLLYDADAAGANAALRGLDLVLAQGLAAYAVALPAGADPDSFVRENGGPAFDDYVKDERQDFTAFIYEQARRSGALDTPEGQAETMRSVVASLAVIDDPLMQESYLRRASDVLDVPDMQLRQVLKEIGGQQRRQAERRAEREAWVPPPAEEAAPAPEEEAVKEDRVAIEPLPEEKVLIRLMLEQGRSLVEFVLGNMAMEEFTEGPAREAVQHFLVMYEAGVVEPQKFLDGSFSEAVQHLAAEVLVDRYEPSENWSRRQNITVPRLNDDPYESAASAMTLLKLDRVDEAIDALREKSFRASGEDTVRALQTEMMALHALRKRIESREFLEWNDVA